MIGIVGRSGSGKSTMVNLLGRFYDVQEGRILVDDIDLRDLPSHQLRERLGIVFQESFMFRGTIWRNLSFGKPNATPEQGLEAAKAAGAHDFICRQQLGYETLLGEHGAGLSGGEKQRLSIARTLLYDPKILILDEATSNIDAEAEKSIQDALKVLIRGRTTIAIAHRLSTLRNADRILLFDQGRLIEQGSHEELLSIDGTYARLVRIQTSVTKNPDIDRLLHHATEAIKENSARQAPTSNKESSKRIGTKGDSSSDRHHDSDRATALLDAPQRDLVDPEPPAADLPNEDPKPPSLHWLVPLQAQFRPSDHDRIELWIDGVRQASSVFIVRTFPASHPVEFLSVRTWNEHGEETECGIIRSLADWPEHDRTQIEKLLARRYLLRQILRVYRSYLASGYLTIDVGTTHGSEQITLRWTQSQAIDYGDFGKLLIDTRENRYLIENVDRLPPEDRERFLQYIYW
ncbi:MAG: DUF1854 domain-containing protein [Planctomycetes bacterium]|nr:DUF1854 domain-containing protein [Planctomycetota bacterium]